MSNEEIRKLLTASLPGWFICDTTNKELNDTLDQLQLVVMRAVGDTLQNAQDHSGSTVRVGPDPEPSLDPIEPTEATVKEAVKALGLVVDQAMRERVVDETLRQSVKTVFDMSIHNIKLMKGKRINKVHPPDSYDLVDSPNGE